MTATLERNETPTPLPRPPSIVGDFRQWLLERGVLAVLIGTPIVAIIGGIFYRVMPYPFLLCAVLAVRHTAYLDHLAQTGLHQPCRAGTPPEQVRIMGIAGGRDVQRG